MKKSLLFGGVIAAALLVTGTWWLSSKSNSNRTAPVVDDAWAADGRIPDIMHGSDGEWNAYKVIAWNAQQSMRPELIARFLRVPSRNALDGESGEAFTGDLWAVILFNSPDDLRAGASRLSGQEAAALVEAAGFSGLDDLWAPQTRANVLEALGKHGDADTFGKFQEQVFDIENLVGQSVKRPAPESIARAIVELDRVGLEDLRHQGAWDGRIDDIIAVLPIDLDGDGRPDWLAYPARFLPTFYGAHAIAFWVFRGQHDGSLSLVLSAARDQVRFLPAMTNGCRDIAGVYASASPETTRWAFSGIRYAEQ